MKEQLRYFVKLISTIYVSYLITRLLFYFFYLPFFQHQEFTSIFKTFIVGSLFDTVAIAYCNSIFIILFFIPITWKYKQSQLKWLFILSNLIFLFFNFIDLGYFEFSKRRTGIEIINLSSQNSKNVLLSYVIDFWYLVVLYILITAFLIKIVSKIYKSHTKLTYNFKDYKVWILYLTILGIEFLCMRGGFFRMPLLTSDAGKFVDAQTISLATNTPHHIISTLQTKELHPKQFMPTEVAENIVKPYYHYPNLTLNKKNVVILILESFDKEYIGYYNNGKGYTPFLDSLIGQSIHFTESFANGYTSIECPPAILSSLPNLLDENYINSRYNTNQLSGIGHLLSQVGYETAFYHGGENGTMNFDSFIGNTNFGKYYGKTEYPKWGDGDGNWGIPDEPYLSYFADELNKSKQPFCKALFTLSSHHPYKVPEKYETILPNGTMPIHKSIAYADMSLKKFFEKIKHKPWFKNTLFVLTADHTSVTDNSAYENYFGNYCVPIIFYGSSITPETISNITIQHKDIMPSLLYKLGYNKKYFTLGKNVFDPIEKPFSLTYQNKDYVFYQKPYLMYLNLNSNQSNLANQITGQAIEGAKKDSIENFVKAYIQVFENRVKNNQLY